MVLAVGAEPTIRLNGDEGFKSSDFASLSTRADESIVS